jgi:hypothetical protein
MSTPGSESPVVLSLGGVSKALSRASGLDVSFDCREGEVHAPSGRTSGKSTSCRDRQRVPCP